MLTAASCWRAISTRSRWSSPSDRPDERFALAGSRTDRPFGSVGTVVGVPRQESVFVEDQPAGAEGALAGTLPARLVLFGPIGKGASAAETDVIPFRDHVASVYEAWWPLSS